MIVDINKLNAKRVEAGMSIESLCSALHIDPATYYRRAKDNGKGFKIGDMHAMVSILNLTNDDAASIFLAKDSH